MKLWGCMDIYGPKINRRLYFAELPWASACLFISNSSRYLLYQPLVTPSPGLSVEGDKSPQTPPTYPAKMMRMPITILMLLHSAAAVCYSRSHRLLINSLSREEPLFTGPHSCLQDSLLEAKFFSSPRPPKWVRNLIFFCLISLAHAVRKSWLGMLKHRQIAQKLRFKLGYFQLWTLNVDKLIH